LLKRCEKVTAGSQNNQQSGSLGENPSHGPKMSEIGNMVPPPLLFAWGPVGGVDAPFALGVLAEGEGQLRGAAPGPPRHVHEHRVALRGAGGGGEGATRRAVPGLGGWRAGGRVGLMGTTPMSASHRGVVRSEGWLMAIQEEVYFCRTGWENGDVDGQTHNLRSCRCGHSHGGSRVLAPPGAGLS